MTSTSDLSATRLDPTDREHYQAGFPHALFSELRAAGPMHRHRLIAADGTQTPFWSLVGHHEIHAVSRDAETFSATDGPAIAPDPMYRDTEILIALDPENHQRLRRLISAGFTPRMIARLEDAIAERAQRILDKLQEGADTPIDFVSQIAFPLPMHVIADIVGIPEEDRAWVFSRTNQLLRGMDPEAGISEAELLALQVETYEYAHELSEKKRANPTDDVWSLLTQTELPGVAGSTWALSGAELDAFFMILTVAGSETTRNALSSGLIELLRHPDQVAAIRADPSLLPAAADEVLRWSSPVLMLARTATRDTELGGQSISAGDRVVMWYPSANRDERVFADPFHFDIGRVPNPHVTFGGGGAHYCLGATLAKRELQVMLGTLLQRFPQIELAGPPRWVGAGPAHNIGVGVSIDSLPVHLGQARP